MNEIINQVEKLIKDMQNNVPSLDCEINSIIERKDDSIKRIENILDILLDYLHLGIGEEQFKKLNSYYATFSAEYSAEYNKLYHEIIDD